MYRFNCNFLRIRLAKSAFTMVEVVAAMVLLSVILSSVLVLMNRYVDSVIDLQLRQEAFELARGNMEQLLAETKLSDITEFGDSEINPDIEWQTLVEPFYEPITNQMWIRAVCSAGFDDSKGEYENIELEHWITNLTAAQVKQILAQQQIESEWMDLLKPGEYSDIQKTTIFCLEQQSLNVKSYKDFLEQQRREKLKYLDKNGMDDWEDFLQQLEDEESEFLDYEIGMDFDLYNDCAAEYVVPGEGGFVDPGPDDHRPDDPGPDDLRPDDPGPDDLRPDDPDCIDCSGLSPEWRDRIPQWFGIPCC